MMNNYVLFSHLLYYTLTVCQPSPRYQTKLWLLHGKNIHMQKVMLYIEKKDTGIRLLVILKVEKSNYSELIVTVLKFA